MARQIKFHKKFTPESNARWDTQGRIQGGNGGLRPVKPGPGPVKSIDFRGFSGPNRCCVPPHPLER